MEELKGKEEEACQKENGYVNGKLRRRNAKRDSGCDCQE